MLAHWTSRLGGVRLVISDHRLGLKTAIAKVFIGAAWQRCRVHFMRNVLANVSRANAENERASAGRSMQVAAAES